MNKHSSVVKKQSWIVLGLVVLICGGVFLIGRVPKAEAGFKHCNLDGVWVVKFGNALLYQTFVTDPGGLRGTVTIQPIVSNDPTFGGLFPDAESPAPGARGNIRRISRDSWAFSIVSHGRSITTPEKPGEIIYIEIYEGVATLTDCDTEVATIEHYKVYSADADADGDGLPDEGAEPVISLEDLEGTAKRI